MRSPIGRRVARLREVLPGSWLWGVALIALAWVPATAHRDVYTSVWMASTLSLCAVGVAALLSERGRRTGDVVLVAALAFALLGVFHHVQPLAQVTCAVLVLGATGLGLKAFAREPEAIEAR